MPNWCYTDMEVYGDYEELVRFREAIRTVSRDETRYGWSLNQLYPIPDELADTVSGWSSDEAVQAEREKRYAENVEKYGYKDWYDWANANWGTKWGAVDVAFDFPDFPVGCNYIALRFQSAWSPATGLIARISEQFPKLVFGTWFDEESTAYVGYEVFHQGDLVSTSFMEHEEMNLPDLDFEDDDSFEAWNDAKNLAMDRMVDLAREQVDLIRLAIA